MTGIDVFSGAGGLTLGARMAGIPVLCGIESDPWAAQTYRANNADANLIEKSVRDVRIADLPVGKEPIILFGGPPCQGFSTSNQKTRHKANPDNWLVDEFLRLAKLLAAEWVVVENVKGISETEDGFFLKRIILKLAKLGYTVSHKMLNSSDYGVPQHRSRYFVVANRKNIEFKFPQPIPNRVSVHEAISDLPILCNGASSDVLAYRRKAKSPYSRNLRGRMIRCSGHLVTKNSDLVIERFTHVPRGGNWQSIPNSLMLNYADKSRCHTGIYRRLKPNEPAIVIGNYRKNMLIHPYQHRGLSVREAARLQSFPDRFVFKGSIGFQQQQVGNAVPPLLAKAVFDAILAAR